MKIDVLLFGVLADVAGKDRITIDDPGDLDNLKKKVVMDIPKFKSFKFQVSVNKTIINENTNLSEGDEVAFLPPFAGG
jgi:molybdopterin converting factor small subunit